MNYENIEPHPYANLFPMMSEEEIKSFAKDIAEKGLMESIVVFEDKILDGRNRNAACKIADVQPHYEFYYGSDPLGYVISLNLHRRHLDESQRAMVAAKLANLEHGGQGGNLNTSIDVLKTSQSTAAKMLNVSVPSVQRAKSIMTHGIDEVSDLVTSGQVSVNAASHFVRLPEEEQSEIAAQGVDAIKAKASEIRNAPKQHQPDESSEPELLIVDGLEEAKKRKIIKIVHEEGLHICSTAKCIMDRIHKTDLHRIKALNEMIEYCQLRISQNQ